MLMKKNRNLKQALFSAKNCVDKHIQYSHSDQEKSQQIFLRTNNGGWEEHTFHGAVILVSDFSVQPLNKFGRCYYRFRYSKDSSLDKSQ